MYDIFGVPMEKPFICFSGIFKWKNNEIISLDDDSYNKELTVYGYEWGHKNAVLLILAGNDWCK